MFSKEYTAEWRHYLTEAGSLPGLDWLRATAISMVVLWHADNSFMVGWTGVDLFFVLSGFLIGATIFANLDRGSLDIRQYFTSRFFRIYPLYFVSMLLFSVVLVVRNDFYIKDIALNLIFHLSFLQTLAPYFSPSTPIYPYGVTWSLVVEVGFYIIVPLFINLLYRKNLKMLTVFILLVIIFYPALRYYIAAPYDRDDVNWHFFLFLRPHYRMDELFYGVLAAVAYRRLTPDAIREAGYWCGWIGSAILANIYLYLIFAVDNPEGRPLITVLTRDTILLPTFLALSFMLITIWSIRIQNAPPVVAAIARLAYPIYLLHNFTQMAFDNILLVFFSSILVSLGASYFIEYPFIRIYRRGRIIRMTAIKDTHPATA